MALKRINSLVCVLFVTASLFSQRYSSWRGPERDGHYPDKGLLDQWPETGPEILWHSDTLGEGYSSPTFYKEKIYLTGNEEEDGYVYVLNMNGEFLWKAKYGRAYVDAFPNTRSTPVLAEDKIYMFSGYGRLVCLDANDGHEIWNLETQKELDGVNLQWGVTENMIIDGDMLFCSVGGKKYNVIALNKNNGKLVWSSPGLGELSAYNSPLLLDRGGKKVLITMMASHIQGHDAENGNLLWSYEQANRWSVHANTPVYSDGALAFTSGYGKGTLQLKLNENSTAVTKSWFNEMADSRMGGAVKLGDYLYVSGDKNRGWHCVDWNTGESKYHDKSLANGVVISADNKLFIYTDRGYLALVKASPDAFTVVNKVKVSLGTMQHWAYPVIHEGRLYLRHGKSLIVYKIK